MLYESITAQWISHVHAKSLLSCPALCNLMDCSPPGTSAHGILQARILEWIAMPSSRGSSQPRDWTWSPASRQLLYHLGSPSQSYIYTYIPFLLNFLPIWVTTVWIEFPVLYSRFSLVIYFIHSTVYMGLCEFFFFWLKYIKNTHIHKINNHEILIGSHLCVWEVIYWHPNWTVHCLVFIRHALLFSAV